MKLAVLSFVCACFVQHACAQGNLLVSPVRIVFEGNKKYHEINLANVGNDTATYLISVVDIRMKEDGSFETITEPDPGQNFAGKYLRYFPRKVTLAPSEAQVVKMQLIKTNELTQGEYRSHLYFRAIKDEKPLGTQSAPKDSKDISVSLSPVFGITIPVIIRVGENTSTVNFSDLSLEMNDKNTPVLSFTFNRGGNMSVYGDIKVEYISPQDKVTEVKAIKGIAVYTPTKTRHIKIELDNDKGVNYKKGKIHLTYFTLVKDKPQKLAEADLALK